jgi:hypothetical protein
VDRPFTTQIGEIIGGTSAALPSAKHDPLTLAKVNQDVDIQAPDTSSYHDDPLMEMEAAILHNPKDLLRARSALRQWLFRDLGEEEQGRSIGDALAPINRGQSDRLVAVVLVRCLAVDGLLPSSNAATRSTA